MTAEQLSDIENGVHMCYKHGKLIDADECIYTPELLADWRTIAERRAQIWHELGENTNISEAPNLPLAKLSISTAIENLTFKIHDTIELGYVYEVWGDDEALTLRDFAIELGRNALTHSSASYFNVEILNNRILLTDDGEPFSHQNLQQAVKKQGGAVALAAIVSPTSKLVTTYQRDNDKNVTVVSPIKHIDEVIRLHPCSVHVTRFTTAAREISAFATSHLECQTLYVSVERGILSYSDLFKMSEDIKSGGLQNRDIILILREHSKGIRDFFAREMPNVKIVEKI